MNYNILVKTILFDEIALPEASLRYKAEIWQQSAHQFFVEIWLLQHYRVKPSFEAENVVADEAFFILETWAFDVYQQTYSSLENALQAACNSLQSKFLLG